MTTITEFAKTLFSVSDGSPRKELSFPNLQHVYLEFLQACDGGYTQDRFFHFLGTSGPLEHNLVEWNRVDLWKGFYSLDEKSFVFAEDIWGMQYFFDIRGDRRVVKSLNPENGNIALSTNTFEDFLEDEVLSDEFNSKAREFSMKLYAARNAKFQPFTHISCKKPVLLGGRVTDLDNLEFAPSLTNLTIYGQLVSQVKHLAPGTVINKVNIKGLDKFDKF
jgi:hypothetical protein